MTRSSRERQEETTKAVRSWWREGSFVATPAQMEIVEIELCGILALRFVIVFLTSEFRSQVTRDLAAAAQELVVGQGSGSIYLLRPQESRRGWRRFVRKVDKPERGGGSQIRSHRTSSFEIVSRVSYVSLYSKQMKIVKNACTSIRFNPTEKFHLLRSMNARFSNF